MRLSRLAPALAAGALLAASVSPAQAQTPEPAEGPGEGVGTTEGALSLLGLDAGGLLSLDLLTDAGLANIDESVGARSAAAQLAALVVESPAAGVSQTLPLLAVESTDGAEDAGRAITPIDNPVVSGSLLPVSLHALVDDAGAASEVTAGLADLDVLGGILGLAGTTIDLGNQALNGDAQATRGVDVDALTVLDLEALLAGLGIPLADLSLDSLLGLIDGLGLLPQLEGALAPLGLDIDGLSAAAVVDLLDATLDGVLAEVDTVLQGVEAVEDLLLDLTNDAAAPVCELTDPVVELVGGLLGGVIGGLPGAPGGGAGGGTGTSVCADLLGDVTGSADALTDQLAELTGTLEGLLDQVLDVLRAPLDVLSGEPLLRLDGLDVTVVTEATDDVATSAAEVTGTLGDLQVGDLSLGSLELAGATAQVDALLGQAEDLLGGVLGSISPALSDLVSVRTMEETTSVVEEGESVVASAAFTGLQVDVLPEVAELLDVLEGLGGEDSVGGVLEGLGLPVPASGATEVLQLSSLLGGVPTGGLELGDQVLALTEGLTVQVASLTQQSRFTPVASPAAPQTPATPAAPTQTPTQTPTLPRTGSDDGLVLLLAGAAVVTAMGGRHLLRRSRLGS